MPQLWSQLRWERYAQLPAPRFPHEQASSLLSPPTHVQAKLQPLIAAELARMHSLDMPGEKKPMLWAFLDSWLAMAKEAVTGLEGDAAEKGKGLDLAWVETELAWLRTVLPSPENGHGSVLSKELGETEAAALALQAPC